MNKTLNNLSIYRKISLAFGLVILFSVFLAVVGVWQLARIQNLTENLTPKILANQYFQEIIVTLQALDAGVERYATVGGEENREHVYGRFSAIIKTTQLLENVADSETKVFLLGARNEVSELKRGLDQLVFLIDREKATSANRELATVYEGIRSLKDAYAKVFTLSNVAFGRSLDEQGKLISTAVQQFILLEISLLLATLVISFVVSRALTKPIVALRDVAQKLSEGDYGARAKVDSGDEIGELGNVFNTMADHLLAYTTKLEDEVAKRTEELKQNVLQLNIKNEMLISREDELTIANNRLRELDKAKSEFISVAAHQLRTPLSAVKWILSIVSDEGSQNLSSEHRSLLLKGYESNERMISLVNEMLEVTRIESGKVVFKPMPIHLEDLIDNILVDFTGQAYVRKIKVEFDHPKARFPNVFVDPDKTRAVLQNLIENAIKYTPDGGAIRATLTMENDFLHFSISDSGIGIPDYQQSAIFSKFFRADNAVKQEADGSGLGLFITKSIVERQGGKIWFESKEGDGSVFHFTVPVPRSNIA